MAEKRSPWSVWFGDIPIPIKSDAIELTIGVESNRRQFGIFFQKEDGHWKLRLNLITKRLGIDWRRGGHARWSDLLSVVDKKLSNIEGSTEEVVYDYSDPEEELVEALNNLSTYAATIHWDPRQRNTKEWLDGLREHIETAQRLTGIWDEQDATDDAAEVPE